VKLLAVDTALGACSVALIETGRVLAHRHQLMDRGHAEALAPMVADVMRGIAFGELGRLAVTTGPGTFTGQRVGLAFMRGMRVALGRPLIGVTRSILRSMVFFRPLSCPSIWRCKPCAICRAGRQLRWLALLHPAHAMHSQKDLCCRACVSPMPFGSRASRRSRRPRMLCLARFTFALRMPSFRPPDHEHQSHFRGG
jgi:hypothetical protein